MVISKERRIEFWRVMKNLFKIQLIFDQIINKQFSCSVCVLSIQPNFSD
jgi:hypothetical protein